MERARNQRLLAASLHHLSSQLAASTEDDKP